MRGSPHSVTKKEWNGIFECTPSLYCSPSGVVYETRAYSKADIDQLVATQGLQCLTSADRQYDFWFAASTPRCQRRANTIATELLLATTNFTARTVPLLRGCVVIATHDSGGDLDGLSWQQLDVLAAKNRSVTNRAGTRSRTAESPGMPVGSGQAPTVPATASFLLSHLRWHPSNKRAHPTGALTRRRASATLPT